MNRSFWRLVGVDVAGHEQVALRAGDQGARLVALAGAVVADVPEEGAGGRVEADRGHVPAGAGAVAEAAGDDRAVGRLGEHQGARPTSSAARGRWCSRARSPRGAVDLQHEVVAAADAADQQVAARVADHLARVVGAGGARVPAVGPDHGAGGGRVAVQHDVVAGGGGPGAAAHDDVAAVQLHEPAGARLDVVDRAGVAREPEPLAVGAGELRGGEVGAAVLEADDAGDDGVAVGADHQAPADVVEDVAAGDGTGSSSSSRCPSRTSAR